MDFKLNKRSVFMSNLNSRAEKHGERNVPAFDLTLEALLNEAETEAVMSVSGIMEALYDNQTLKGAAINPIAVNRKPENIIAHVEDDEGKMVFEKAKVKGISVLLAEDERRSRMKFKLQFAIDPEEESDSDELIARLNYLQKENFKLKLVPGQKDMFDSDQADQEEQEQPSE